MSHRITSQNVWKLLPVMWCSYFLWLELWNYNVLQLLRLETIMFSDAMFYDVNVVWCYVLTQHQIILLGLISWWDQTALPSHNVIVLHIEKNMWQVQCHWSESVLKLVRSTLLLKNLPKILLRAPVRRKAVILCFLKECYLCFEKYK